jgi:hypothetical protein
MKPNPCGTCATEDSATMPTGPEEKHTDTQERRTGVLLVNEGLVRQADVEIALEIQEREAIQTALHTKTHPRTIGEILCDLNLITPLDLSAVLKKYSKHLKLEEILIKKGDVDEEALTATLEAVESRTEPIGKILLQKGIITETQLYEAYSLQYNLPFKPFDQFPLPLEDRAMLSSIIGKDFARRFGVLPVDLDRKHLSVVISDPENLKVVEAFRAKQTDLRIECTFVTAGTFNRLFKLLYAKEPLETRPEPVKSEIPLQRTTQVKSKHRSDALSSDEASIYTEVLSNPETQREAVVRLHTAYERLATSKGLRTGASDPQLFGKFIQHHFHRICRRYRCRHVSFSILDRQPHITITAMPIQPSD